MKKQLTHEASGIVGKIKCGVFAISIDDGFCEWSYKLQISKEASIHDVAEAIAKAFNVKLPRGKPRRKFILE